MIHAGLRSVNTCPGAKGAAFLRRVKRKIPQNVTKIYFRSDSACYNKEVITVSENEGWKFSIPADQTGPLMGKIETLPEDSWQRDKEGFDYAEMWYQPVGWPKAYRYLVKREREKNKTCQRSFFQSMAYSYSGVVTRRDGDVPGAYEDPCEERKI